jgi:hypothetical protein
MSVRCCLTRSHLTPPLTPLVKWQQLLGDTGHCCKHVCVCMRACMHAFACSSLHLVAAACICLQQLQSLGDHVGGWLKVVCLLDVPLQHRHMPFWLMHGLSQCVLVASCCCIMLQGWCWSVVRLCCVCVGVA